MSSPEPIVAKGLGRQFGDNVVIEPLDVSVDRGQRVGIVGADGAGMGRHGEQGLPPPSQPLLLAQLAPNVAS